jgi:lysozyme family protein
MDPVEVAGQLCDNRLSWLRTLSNWNTFGRGWSRRVEGVKAHALKLAAAGPVDKPQPKGLWDMFKNLLNLFSVGGLGGLLGSCEQVTGNLPSQDTMLPLLILVILAVVNGGDIGELLKKFLGNNDKPNADV